jgi:hypothetical protein
MAEKVDLSSESQETKDFFAKFASLTLEEVDARIHTLEAELEALSSIRRSLSQKRRYQERLRKSKELKG